MSYLKEKSEFNADAAQLLIDESLFAPSVHCAYYSVFQLLKYLFTKEKNISFNQLSQNIASGKRNTHQYLIEEFCLYLQTLNNQYFDRYLITKLEDKVNDLKQLRVESDYYDAQIDSIKSNKALQISEEIIQELKRIR